MKGYDSRLRVPLKDYTNVICMRNCKNVSKTNKKVFENDNLFEYHVKTDLKMPKNTRRVYLRDETVQVLDDINRRECHVFLNKDEIIEKQIFKRLGEAQVLDDINRKDCQVILNKNESIENEIIKRFGEKVSSDINKESLHTKNLPNKNTKRNLRKRNSKQNFAEKSLNESNDNSKLIGDNHKDKRPIYRRISQFKESKKKINSDVYTFDFSSESEMGSSHKKKKKIGHRLNTSLPFERYMKEIVMKLDEKHDKEKDKITKRNVKKVTIRDKKKNKVQKKTKINPEKKIKNVSKNKNTEVIISNLNNKVENIRKQITSTPIEQRNFSPVIFNLDNNKFELNQQSLNKTPNRNLKTPQIEKIKIISNVNIVTSKNIQNQLTSTPIQQRNSSPDIFDSDNNEDYVPNDQLLNKTPNTNRFLNTPMSPIANINDFEASPWRFNVEVRRNPHFLQYKRSLLPNYNQEMVLDSSLIEKRSFNKSTTNSNVPIRKQSSILKYVSGGKNIENLDSINLHESSLFDAHNFISPEKRKSPNKKKSFENKENINKKIDVVKRNILGSKPDLNFDENVTPKTNLISRRYPRKEKNILGPKLYNEENIRSENDFISENESASSKSKSDFFGFDVSESELISNQDTPRRIEDVIKKIVKVQKNVYFDVENEPGRRKISTEKIDDAEANLQEIGFFDYQDKEPERNLDLDTIKQYKRQRGKRRRSVSPSGTESEDDGEHPRRRRKKKNQRTRAEEAAAEKWYAEFNKMCEEVDQFPLEIEKVK